MGLKMSPGVVVVVVVVVEGDLLGLPVFKFKCQFHDCLARKKKLYLEPAVTTIWLQLKLTLVATMCWGFFPTFLAICADYKYFATFMMSGMTSSIGAPMMPANEP